MAAGELTKEMVRTYRARNPSVEVVVRELSFTEQYDVVASGEVDVAVVRPPCRHDDLRLDLLFDEPIVLCCSDDHRLAEADELGVEDVLDEPMLDMAGSPPDWADFWHLSDYRGGPPRTSGDPVASLAELKLAVTFGSAITPVCSSAWRLGLADPSLRSIAFRDAPRSAVAVATRGGESREQVLAFTELARALSETLVESVPDATLIG